MIDKNLIRGPDEEKNKELLDEIQIMIIFQNLIKQDMREFVKNCKNKNEDKT